MDPISIIGSAVAVVQLCGLVTSSVSSSISAIREVPDELYRAKNEVTDFEWVLMNVQECIDQEVAGQNGLSPSNQQVGTLTLARSNPTSNPLAGILVERARACLLGIEAICKEYGCDNGVKEISWRKRVRQSRRANLQKLVNELRNIKQSIGMLFAVQSSAHAFRSASTTVQLGATISSIQTETLNHGQRLEDVVQRLSLIGGGMPGNTRPSSLAREDQSTAPTPIDAGTTSSVVKLDISRFKKKNCQPFCSCKCHRRHRKKFPSLSNKVLGALFLGYSCLPFTGSGCDDENCEQRSRFSATFTYYFPSWFFRRSLSLILMTTSLGDIGGVIKIRQIQYSDFSMFRSSEQGDSTTIMSLLDSRKAHPSASWCGGWTALHASRLSIPCRSRPD